MTEQKQRVSNWVPTGSHSFCPNGHPEMVVAVFTYGNDHQGKWEYMCPVCGLSGPAEMRKKDSDVK